MLHFNGVGVGSYEKIGGEPPSPWCYKGEERVAQLLVVVATLLRERMESHRSRGIGAVG